MRLFGWFRSKPIPPPQPIRRQPPKDELAQRRFRKAARGTIVHIWYTETEVSWSYPADWDDPRGLGQAMVNAGGHMLRGRR